MIGTRIEGRAGFPAGTVVWLVVAAAFAAPALALGNPHPAIFAALPALIGLGLLAARARPFDAQLTRAGLEIDEPPLSLPYAAIEAALISGTPGRARAPIRLVHRGGVVHIPARLNVRSDDLYAFLLEHLPAVRPRDLPGELAEFGAAEEARCGAGVLFTYRARPQRAKRPRRVAVAVSLASAFAGVAWAAAGALLPRDGAAWIALGILLALFGGLFAVGFAVEGGPKIRNWQESGLVISPAGLAMVQGEMRGELRWDEVRDIRLAGGIRIVVAGATILIADVYDRPLSVIYQRLLASWRGQP